MKKSIFRGLIAAILLVCFIVPTSVFAVEQYNNLPYVDGLGYEVDVFEDDDVSFYNYDSLWKDYLGGRWRHGVDEYHVWSWFDHDKKLHKTTVQGAGGKYGYSGWTDPGERAKASWEKASYGNKAWVDVDE